MQSIMKAGIDMKTAYRLYTKVPTEFVLAVTALIKWRDNTKYRRKAMAIQRAIDRKIRWADEYNMKMSLYMYSAGHGYDLYGKGWGKCKKSMTISY